MSRRTAVVTALVIGACLVGAAFAQGLTRSTGASAVGPAQAVALSPLQRPAKLLQRTITVGVHQVRAEARQARRAEHRRARRKRMAEFATLPGGVSQETLDTIAACESGGDPTAISSGGTYRGKFQFDYGTWASVGGSGDPAAAPEAEQDYRAALLYSQSGSSPWPVCGQ